MPGRPANKTTSKSTTTKPKTSNNSNGIKFLNETLTPIEIVEELDKYIIGQRKAKKAVAVALRNRARRQALENDLKEEIAPKNIIMIGPTGVGKTEIARRLSKLSKAPFIKVEATKYTEVGYVGRDVEAMIRDLTGIAVGMVKKEYREKYNEKAQKLVKDQLVTLLMPKRRSRTGESETRESVREKLEEGKLEKKMVKISVDEPMPTMIEIFSGSGLEDMDMQFQNLLSGMNPPKIKEKKVSVKDARKVLHERELDKLIDMDTVVSQAVKKVEEMGIVFLDEIDKIVGNNGKAGPDVSREGVQRDILPIIEGSTVNTRFGPVKTDHILFIAAGAFHTSKPSDLIPELQGRFPIRVELDSLEEGDLKKILTEPKNALIKQYKALLKTESINVEFENNAIDEISKIAYSVNSTTENIGARRLHTIMERLLEEVSFEAPNLKKKNINIDSEYVKERLSDVIEDRDLSRYIL